MGITVFDPKKVAVGPIGSMLAERVDKDSKYDGLRDFFNSKADDGNLSAVVIGDSAQMAVGVGTFAPGQYTKKPIPVLYDETLFIVEGSFNLQRGEDKFHAIAGECVNISKGSMVTFGSDEGVRLVWVTSPPTWLAMQDAFLEGKVEQ